MNTNKLMMAALAVMLAGWSLPGVQGAPVNCATWVPAGQCEIIAGPASLELKGLVEVGLGGVCHDETGDPAEEDIPLFCRETTGPSAAGGADFPNGAAPVYGAVEEITIQVQWEDPPGGCTPLVCGFKLSGCNDRNHNNFCTNVGNQDDQLVDAYSNDGLADKSSKDGTVLDFDDAGLVFCALEPVDAIWQAGDIIVFIGAWVGTLDPNGAGVSFGTFSVGYSTAAACAIPAGGITFAVNCIWERDDLDNTGGSAGADDCGGAGGKNLCPDGSVAIIVVFIGIDSNDNLSGSTTASPSPDAADDDCIAAAVTANELDPLEPIPVHIDSAAADAGAPADPLDEYYLCSFTWDVLLPFDPIEAGACIVV